MPERIAHALVRVSTYPALLAPPLPGRAPACAETDPAPPFFIIFSYFLTVSGHPNSSLHMCTCALQTSRSLAAVPWNEVSKLPPPHLHAHAIPLSDALLDVMRGL